MCGWLGVGRTGHSVLATNPATAQAITMGSQMRSGTLWLNSEATRLMCSRRAWCKSVSSARGTLQTFLGSAQFRQLLRVKRKRPGVVAEAAERITAPLSKFTLSIRDSGTDRSRYAWGLAEA